MSNAGFRSEEKTIGEYRYRVTQLDTLTGIDVATRLVTKFGSALSGSGEHNVQIAGSIAEKLTGEEVKYYVNLFAKRTEVLQDDGKEPFLNAILDVHFAGRYGDLVKWLTFCFEVNFQDFFVMVRERIGPLVKAMMASDSSSPSISKSAGSSGDS